jgi:hypothetical protein
MNACIIMYNSIIESERSDPFHMIRRAFSPKLITSRVWNFSSMASWNSWWTCSSTTLGWPSDAFMRERRGNVAWVLIPSNLLNFNWFPLVYALFYLALHYLLCLNSNLCTISFTLCERILYFAFGTDRWRLPHGWGPQKRDCVYKASP